MISSFIEMHRAKAEAIRLVPQLRRAASRDEGEDVGAITRRESQVHSEVAM